MYSSLRTKIHLFRRSTIILCIYSTENRFEPWDVLHRRARLKRYLQNRWISEFRPLPSRYYKLRNNKWAPKFPRFKFEFSPLDWTALEDFNNRRDHGCGLRPDIIESSCCISLGKHNIILMIEFPNQNIHRYRRFLLSCAWSIACAWWIFSFVWSWCFMHIE